jgi:transposase
MVNEVLERLAPEFDKIYSKRGRHSIPPEQLLRALLLQVLFSIRSERQLVEQLDYNLLYRWFVGLGMDDPVWVPTVFTKNRDRLLEGDIADAFFAEVLRLAEDRKLVSREHFSVDGTLIEAWAGIKSFRRKGDDDDDSRPGVIGRNPDANFHGEKLSNETHQSTTDPESRLAKKSKGKEAKLSYAAHITTENRNGLVVAARVTQAHGRAERESALEMLEKIPRRKRITVGADKNYDYKTFTEPAREIGVTPHVAQLKTSSIDRRTTRHPGYAISSRVRKRVEEVFGWAKTVGLLRKTRHRGRRLVDWIFRFTTAIYNLVRIRNLELAAA